MLRQRLTAALLATMLALPLAAQQGGGNRATQEPDPQSGRDAFDRQSPVFLSGRVTLDDGSAPPERVLIERVCTGLPMPEGYTDSKGNFSFEMGRRLGVQNDASTNAGNDAPAAVRSRSATSAANLGNQQIGFRERDLMSCEIRAVLAGYSAQPVLLAGRRLLDRPDLGTIVLRPIGGVKGFTFSATTALASKDARKSFDKGTEHLEKRKFADAQKQLEKAVADSPKFAAAWSSLGSARFAQNDTAGAREAFLKAAEADERFVTPHLQLMTLHGQLNEWNETARESQRVIELNPVQFPQAYFYNATAHLNLKNYDQAEAAAREAVRLDEQHRYPRAEFVLGLLAARKGNYAEAVQLLRGYAAKVEGADLEAANKQLAEVERRLAATK